MTTTKNPTEIWFTTTRKGQRQAWHFERMAFRAMRLPMVEAEAMIATGEGVESTKPAWVGR